MRTLVEPVCRLWFVGCGCIKQHTTGQLRTTNHKLQTLVIFTLTVLFSSCLKEEDPITPPNLQGNVETAQIPMGAQYLKQYYFDLGANQIVGSNLKNEWDLGFECGVDGYHIILNGSKFMFSWNMQTKAFEDVHNHDNATQKWDVASGNLDSTAIGEWGEYADRVVVSDSIVYVIDRGRNFDNSSLGFKKVVFQGMKDNTFTIRFANVDGTDEHIAQVTKDENYSFVYFSFDDGGKQVTVVPPKTEWDLVFTQYTHIFDESDTSVPQPIDSMIPYLVTGVLFNPHEVVGEKEFYKPFNDLTIDDATSRLFADPSNDVIGFAWKYFNLDEVEYTVIPEQVYLVRDTEGYLYKLHFIDFYNDTGERGYPKFEFQRL